MIDIFHAIHACADLADYWDVGRRSSSVVLRVRSRTYVASEQDASGFEAAVADRIRSLGHEIREISSVARLDPSSDHSWRVFVELVIG